MCEQVDLSNNFLTGGYPYTELDGIKAIAEAIAVTPSITSIDLSENDFGPEGAKALAPAIAVNASVTSVCAFGNSRSSGG
jgi:Ran GTPase-activating protein (RanGAP) involved in mRNA processing and transport